MKKLCSLEDSISKIDDLIEYSWQKALKYKFDPVVGRIYDDYLEMLKHIKNQQVKNESDTATKNRSD